MNNVINFRQNKIGGLSSQDDNKLVQELEVSRSKYADLYDFAPVGYFTLDKNGVILEANLTGATLIGIERNQLLNKPFSNYLTEDSQDIFFLHRQQIFSEKNKKTCEVGVVKEAGTHWYAQLESIAVEDSEGTAGHCHMIVRDISGQHRAKEDLEESKNDLRTIIDHIQAGITLIDPETHLIVDINAYALGLIGFQREQIINHICHKFICPTEIGKCPITDLQQEVNLSERVLINANGKRIPIMKSVTQVTLQGRAYLLESFIDITDRKQAEKELKESEEKYHNLVERANDGIIIVQDTIVKFANQRMAELDGSSVEQIVGTPFTDHVHPDELPRLMENYQRRMAGENISAVYETVLQRQDGSLIPSELNAGVIIYQRRPANLIIIRDITERKQAEKEVRDVKKSLENIFKVSPDIIMLTDAEGNITSINTAAEKLLGYSPDELVEKHSSILIPDEGYRRKSKDEMIANSYEKNSILNFECYWRKKQGGVCPIECSFIMLRNDTGDIIGGVSFARDITERKLAEEKVHKTKEQLENFIDNSIDPIIIGDSKGCVVKPNKAFLEMIGYSEDEIIGLRVEALSVTDSGTYESTTGEMVKITDEFFRENYAVTADLFETGKIINWETYYLHKSGKIIPVMQNIVLIHDNDGEITSPFCTVRDLTGQKKAESVLRESEESFRAITESSLDAIITTDDQNNIIFCNSAAEKIFGYSKEELVGKFAEMLIPERFRERNKNSAQNAVKDKNPRLTGKPIEVCGLNKDNQEFPLEVSVSAYKIYDRVYFAATVHDLTERRKLEEQIRQSQKMEAIGTLAGGVAHDLNNILSALISYPELLLLNLPEDSPMRKPIISIKSAGEKAAAIVDDLLTMARRGVNVAEVVNLNAVLTDYFNTAHYEKLRFFHPNVEFNINCTPNLLNTVGSPVHLSKTVMNLISNAAEAMTDGGKLTISTDNQYLDKPIKGYANIKEGEYIVMTVEDTGIGIPKEELTRIFEPFFTKKAMGRSGTGLGLAIVWGTMQDHNGYIDVNSTLGKGTTFKLYFPATRREIEDKKEALPIEKYSGHGESILVVDDIESQREIASHILQKLNYRVETVTSGEKAVEYLQSKPVDLVVLDMSMDPGIDGLETYRRILDIQPQQKAIIASGFSATERVNEAQRLGVGAYIKKPYIMSEIGMAVKNELTKRAVSQKL
jgi:PAS domain S-box-containing protein